ncbi:PREDICTED: F-box/FBD/LRR-repeat protein At5g56420-like [Camelina sativa]|uniref:F-box/FBD/LRR-repeat protein At5g56420-like n=1 Tax=Camelina sativa TaxID=90675 RepID=A0ABM0UR20_CAMSA|nr:PREDICTED: F-box/FBD/LRR-repeat protein At5g56420-like [Camelina sativa]
MNLLEVPSRVSFQSLKTLRLKLVAYPDEESFVRLISSSPVLGDLLLQNPVGDNIETFTINVPSLHRLTITRDEKSYLLFVIHCHSLKELDIENDDGEVNLIGDMRELVKANIWTCDSNVFKSLTFVKTLRLTVEDYKAPYHFGTIFSQLVCLEFRGQCYNWWDLLLNVLQHSPRLQILTLEDCYREQVWGDREIWIQPSCAPECLYHLKTFEWIEYVGSPIQKELICKSIKDTNKTKLGLTPSL